MDKTIDLLNMVSDHSAVVVSMVLERVYSPAAASRRATVHDPLLFYDQRRVAGFVAEVEALPLMSVGLDGECKTAPPLGSTRGASPSTWVDRLVVRSLFRPPLGTCKTTNQTMSLRRCPHTK